MLVPFEWGLKLMLDQEATSFFGPTIAAAGLSFLIPLTEPKVLSVNGNIMTTSVNDNRLIGLLWILILISLFAWAASCYYSLKRPADLVFDLCPYHLLIGGSVYLLSIVMSYVKRRLV